MTNSKMPSHRDADPNAISIEAALHKIKALLTPFEQTETVSREHALGRITACDIVASENIPPFRSAAMDGYAFKHAEANSTLFIAATSLAGHPSQNALAPASCVRITTGARVPDDADTVVQQENCTVKSDSVCIDVIPSKSMHVRNIGSDIAKGEPMISANSCLMAAEIALLAAHRISHVHVLKKLKIGIFSTGDELTDPDSNPDRALATGCITDSNRPLLTSLLTNPAFELMDLGIVKDDVKSIEQAFVQAKSADIIISSGGVSVGDADYVKTVLETLGELHLWKIAMKPGRPLSFGILKTGQAFFGLPGNPVSSAVTTLLFVLPSLHSMLGLADRLLPRIPATLNGEANKIAGRVEYQRAHARTDENGELQVSNTGLQDSHRLTSFHQANCFIELPLESDGAKNGEIVQILPFSLFGCRLV